MRQLLTLTLLALAACATPERGSTSLVDLFAPRKLYAEISLPSVIVRGKSGQGSGTVIAQDRERALVLTAWHVVNDSPRPAVLRHYVEGSERLVVEVGTVIAGDAKTDLALISTAPIWGDDAASVVDADELGELFLYVRVVSYGHPLGVVDGQLADGFVSDWDDNGFVRYSCHTYYGNSGGGVFAHVAGRWKLISVCQAGYRSVTGDGLTELGLGAQPRVILKFLAERPAPPAISSPPEVCPTCGVPHSLSATSDVLPSHPSRVEVFGVFLCVLVVALLSAVLLEFVFRRGGRKP